jgi:hypothetical protein
MDNKNLKSANAENPDLNEVVPIENANPESENNSIPTDESNGQDADPMIQTDTTIVAEVMQAPENIEQQVETDAKASDLAETSADDQNPIEEPPTPEPDAPVEPEKVVMAEEADSAEVPAISNEDDSRMADQEALSTEEVTEEDADVQPLADVCETEALNPDEKVLPPVEPETVADEDHQEDEAGPDEGLLKEIVSAETPVDELIDADAHDEELLSEPHAGNIEFDSMTREVMVEMLENLVNQDDLNGIKTQVAMIKVAFNRHCKEIRQAQINAFLAEGGLESDFQYTPDELEHRFDAVFNIYREKKLHFSEEMEKQKQLNLEAKLAILEELRALISSEETLKKTYDDFRDLQDKWRQIGIVPKNEVNTLWSNYHFLVEKFFDKVKINKELKDLDLKKNLESKIELCEKAEELLLETNVMKSFKELQKLHEQWKEIGPVPGEKKDEIWDRFKSATDKINSRRREHYDKLHHELQGNHESKLALIEKAKEISETPSDTIKQWQDKTNALNELFKIWKSVGPAPRKVNDEVWGQFKEVLDAFFGQKSEFFNKIKEQQLHNYNLKLDLCLQAEALMNSSDWKSATRDLIALQKEWKQIGPVPRKHSDKIWKRFRTACDHFFKAKEEFFSTIHDREGENLKIKEDLIRQVEEHPYTDNKNENLRVIKDFQRKWVEIGYVPIKEKDRLQNEFRKAVDKQLDKLNISALEMNALNYKARFENSRELPEGSKTIMREIGFLQGKVVKMTEDVNLWENNLGFLANSKNADILRVEFERKIEKTRQEIKLMEAKIKFLRDELNK